MTTEPAPDLTTTQKLWRPISELDKEQEQVRKQLVTAAGRGDIEEARRLVGRMEEIHLEMHQAGQNAREHARQKALASSTKSQPDKSNYPAIGQMLQNALTWAIETGVVKAPVSTTTEDDHAQA